MIDDVSWDFRRSAPVDDFRLRYVRRGFDAKVPYCVNIATDPAVAYPRNTTGI